MSASLVGSEMCIRDSCTTVAIAIARDFARDGLDASAWWRSQRCQFCALSCLLYTSDAADDM
eukprot:13153310-Alexandrium_andersonii.AAC.1